MRFHSLAVVAAMVFFANLGSVHAGVLVFNADVAMNFSALGAGTDQNPVNSIDFGSASLPGSARFAYNGSDTNSNGVLDAGDTARIVGHGLVDTFDGLGVSAGSFTAQLRNVDGTVDGFGRTIFDAGNYAAGTGLLDLYVDSAGFSVLDAATSSSGTLAATFRILSGAILPTVFPGTVSDNDPVSATRFTAELVYNNNGFLTTTSGQAFTPGGLNVFTSVATTDRVVLIGDQSLANINGDSIAGTKNFSGANPLLDIGAGFDPQTGAFVAPGTRPLDLVLSVTGDAAFAAVPEPASFLIVGGLCGLVTLQRRRKAARRLL